MIIPGFNYRNWATRLKQLIMEDPDPKKIALALALGFSSAFLPPFGFHTFLVMGVGYLMGVSVPLAILGTWVNNPWTFVPLFLPAYVLEIDLGAFILHRKVYFPALGALSRMPYQAILAQVKLVLWPLFVGSVIFSAGVFIISFFSTYGFLRFRRGFPDRQS